MSDGVPVPTSEIKTVFMDVAVSQDGGMMTRKRRGRGRRTTAKQEGGGEDATGYTATVIKADGPAPAPVPAPTPMQIRELAPVAQAQTGGAKKTPVAVVLAPAKKRVARVMLVPRKPGHMAKTLKRPFKAKRIHVTIDHSAKTQKRRRQLSQRLDSMTDEQVRDAAVLAQLSRRDSVANTPTALLRQMLRDYQTMKGMLL